MIKFVITPTEAGEQPHKICAAKLSLSPYGYLNLVINGWDVLRVIPDGTFQRIKGVPGNLGLNVDYDGQIVES